MSEIIRNFTDAEVASPEWPDLLRRNGIDPEQPYDTVPLGAELVRIIQPSRRAPESPAHRSGPMGRLGSSGYMKVIPK